MTRGNYKGRRRPGLIQVFLALVLAGCLCFTALLALVLSGARFAGGGWTKIKI